MQISIVDVPRQLAIAYMAGANIWMWGKPALAKTAIAEAFARIMKRRIPEFQNWYFYVPTCGPTDIQAAMPNTETGLLDFFSNGALPNAYTDPDVVGVLHLGELANGDSTTVKLLQKYVATCGCVAVARMSGSSSGGDSPAPGAPCFTMNWFTRSRVSGVTRAPSRSRATNLPSLTARRPKVDSAMPVRRQKSEMLPSRVPPACLSMPASIPPSSVTGLRPKSCAPRSWEINPHKPSRRSWDTSHCMESSTFLT